VHARSLAFQSIAFAALSSIAACAVPTDQGAAAPPEIATEAAARDALGDEATSPSLPVETPVDPSKWLKEHLPKWKVYLGGSPYDAWHYARTEPNFIDESSPLYAEREEPPVKLELSAVQLRDVGIRHVWWLVDKYDLDILDILVLSAMLDVPLGQIPVIRPKGKSKHKSRSTIRSTSDDATDDDDRLTCELDDGEERDDVTPCEDDPPSPGIPGDWGCGRMHSSPRGALH
jgi:hypothetical protein